MKRPPNFLWTLKKGDKVYGMELFRGMPSYQKMTVWHVHPDGIGATDTEFMHQMWWENFNPPNEYTFFPVTPENTAIYEAQFRS